MRDALFGKSKKVPLVLIRHGPTQWNHEGRMQGRSDQPLSQAGKREVASWRPPTEWNGYRWLTSPLTRAQQTAELLGAQSLQVEPLLIEMDWGAWEGKVLAELRQDDPAGMAQAEAKGLDFRAPGGESPRDVQRRLQPFLQDLARSQEPTVAVTHKGIIRALYALAAGWPMLGKPPVKLKNACAHAFLVGSDGTLAVQSLNIPLTATGTEAANKGSRRTHG